MTLDQVKGKMIKHLARNKEMRRKLAFQNLILKVKLYKSEKIIQQLLSKSALEAENNLDQNMSTTRLKEPFRMLPGKVGKPNLRVDQSFGR